MCGAQKREFGTQHYSPFSQHRTQGFSQPPIQFLGFELCWIQISPLRCILCCRTNFHHPPFLFASQAALQCRLPTTMQCHSRKHTTHSWQSRSVCEPLLGSKPQGEVRRGRRGPGWAGWSPMVDQEDERRSDSKCDVISKPLICRHGVIAGPLICTSA